MLAASIIALLQITPAEADKAGGVWVSYGKLASVGVWANVRVERHDGTFSQHDRFAIQLHPFPDPRWRERDSFTLSTGRRLDLAVESNLHRPVDQGGFELLKMVATNHTVLAPLLPYIPPLEYPD